MVVSVVSTDNDKDTTPTEVSLGVSKTFVTYMRNFPFFLSPNFTATFAKLSQKLLAR